MRKFWPKARIIGIEPLGEHWRFMRKAKWLPDEKVEAAIYSVADQTVTFHLNYEPDQRATIYDLPVEIENEITREIPTVTLDQIVARYSPLGDTLLWMDIEGGEYEALRNSCVLFDPQSELRWINIEMNLTPPRNMPPWAAVNGVLEDAGWRLLSLHSATRSGRQFDGIYIRQPAWEALRIAIAEGGKRRKLDRLKAGRGKTGNHDRHQEQSRAGTTYSDGRHTGTSRRDAPATQGPA
jgi:FkbM family methyltransferase